MENIEAKETSEKTMDVSASEVLLHRIGQALFGLRFDKTGDELLKGVIEAAEDSTRLTWMDAHAFTLYRGIDPETGELNRHAVAVAEDGQGSRRGEVHETVRASIDGVRLRKA